MGLTFQMGSFGYQAVVKHLFFLIPQKHVLLSQLGQKETLFAVPFGYVLEVRLWRPASVAA